MNVDNEKVVQQSVLLIYTVLPCQSLEEIFIKILSSKPRQHAREVVSVFEEEETERERRLGGRKEKEGRERDREGRETDLPLIP